MEQFGRLDSGFGPDGSRPTSAPGGDDGDAELARAIEASYASQTDVGMHQSEDDMLAEVMRVSALEEEERKKRAAPADEDSAVLAVDDDVEPRGTSASSHTRAVPVRPADVDMGGRRSAGAELGSTSDSMQDDLAAVAGLLHADDSRPSTAGVGAMLRHLGTTGGGDRGESLAPEGMDADFMAAAAVAEQAENMDRELAMAIEASYTATTEHGRIDNEGDLLAQALKISKLEDEARERAELRNSQEMELKESILMDQMREDEQKRRRTEDEQLQKMEGERVEEEVKRRETDERQKKDQSELKRGRIPEEPPVGEPGRVDIMIKMPDGKRMRRAFRGTDSVGQVYDYVDVEGAEAVANMEQYRLVTSMPRQAYDDRSLTLSDAGFKGQCALLIEAMHVQ